MGKNLIILPVYNRADSIAERVNLLDESLGNQTDILVVDDGSEDGTTEAVKPTERIFVLSHEESRGYGLALMNGLGFARDHGYDYAFTLDTIIPNYHFTFTPMLKELASGQDLVSCSRMTFEDRGVADEDYSAIDTGNIVSDMLNGACGYSLIDPFSPFKGFRVSALENFELSEFDEAAIIQIWIQSAYHGLRIKEIICPEIHCGYIHEGEYLEKDIDHYLDFIESEKILYPVGEHN
jgi:glycosyltransferase involved in cell wall biosynthesis